MFFSRHVTFFIPTVHLSVAFSSAHGLSLSPARTKKLEAFPGMLWQCAVTRTARVRHTRWSFQGPSLSRMNGVGLCEAKF